MRRTPSGRDSYRTGPQGRSGGAVSYLRRREQTRPVVCANRRTRRGLEPGNGFCLCSMQEPLGPAPLQCRLRHSLRGSTAPWIIRVFHCSQRLLARRFV
ncbi:hypothetical protein NDU88_003847 [Pleurodeles waltl]|uniref:Uncharacterized protein n=1 Tax=Pleurodeles waltl TaxID=8319 RepID=A0AAV7UDR0_PLEWA|nr:hypothetical protein NDU88_003847 [Pleurodeles waltl]